MVDTKKVASAVYSVDHLVQRLKDFDAATPRGLDLYLGGNSFTDSVDPSSLRTFLELMRASLESKLDAARQNLEAVMREQLAETPATQPQA